MDPRFDWDAENLNHIWDRHRVTDEEAEEVYDDDRRFTYRSDAEGEERLAVVGSTASGRPLTIVITPRRGLIRVVTAREQDLWEAKRYRRRGKRGRK